MESIATTETERDRQAPAVAAPAPGVGRRLVPLDALRGVIMILMALDHTAFFVAKRHPAEFWGVAMPVYDGWLPFLTRFLTHLCAPGFFFLMGAGIVLLTASRDRSGWTTGRISRHLAIRGFVLILVGQTVELVPWIVGAFVPEPSAFVFEVVAPGGGGMMMMVLGVLYGLGASMIVCSLLIRAPSWLLMTLGVAAVMVTQVVTPGPESVSVLYAPWIRALLIPGHTDFIYVLYPVIPWLGLTLFGMGLGRLLMHDRVIAYRVAALTGMALLALFFVARAAGGFGNFHPYDGSGAIGFLNVTKYPPSLAFVTVTLGLNLLLLALFEQISAVFERFGEAVLVFGKTALFFYIVHLYLYAILGLPFRTGTGYGLLYLAWAIGLVMLYWPCRWYLGFKRAKPPSSIWRLF